MRELCNVKCHIIILLLQGIGTGDLRLISIMILESIGVIRRNAKVCGLACLCHQCLGVDGFGEFGGKIYLIRDENNYN